eukprot:m.1395007 g.1395007  ORF g.1395007 m.1395007 type:complete len:166 (-) comp24993_c0_seq21:203-700(-)
MYATVTTKSLWTCTLSTMYCGCYMGADHHDDIHSDGEFECGDTFPVGASSVLPAQQRSVAPQTDGDPDPVSEPRTVDSNDGVTHHMFNVPALDKISNICTEKHIRRESTDAGWGFELDSTADQHGVWVHLVFSVQRGGAAMRAGLRHGEVLVAVDGKVWSKCHAD